MKTFYTAVAASVIAAGAVLPTEALAQRRGAAAALFFGAAMGALAAGAAAQAQPRQRVRAKPKPKVRAAKSRSNPAKTASDPFAGAPQAVPAKFR